MAKIENVNKVMDYLKARLRKSQRDNNVSVKVGYTQSYAIYVHEDLQAYHHVGQAKFLEQPARQLGPEFIRIIKDALTKGLSMSQALLLAGLKLQRESQLLVPIDTGALKGSAFTVLDRG